MSKNQEKDPAKGESLYDLWGRRSVNFEIDLEEKVIRRIADYGSGSNSYTSAKGFYLGAGYEVFILAFFIGLYENKRRPIDGEKKTFGYPIQNWGNMERRGLRKPYGKLRDYIFAACIARTDINLMDLERGTIPANVAVSSLINTMEEYANFGLHRLLDILEEDKYYFSSNNSFLQIFLPLFQSMNMHGEEVSEEKSVSDKPEPLD